jgi:OOP family OmpA-OmpF porin
MIHRHNTQLKSTINKKFMRKFIMAGLVLTMPFTMQAQFGGLLNKAKSKVEGRVNNKVDQAMEKGLDEAEGKAKPAPVETTKEETTSSTKSKSEPAEKATIKSYSKFDFVPGEKVLYTEDFAQDVIGELPTNWNASGKGEVVTVDGKPGKWLRIFQGNTYLPGNKKEFGENFTVEFDMIYYFDPKVTGYVLPNAMFGLFSSGKEDQTDNAFLKDQGMINSTEISIAPHGEGAARVVSYKAHTQNYSSDRMSLNKYGSSFNKVVHFSMQVQKQRLRMWVNDTKVFDIPRAVNTHEILNQVFFQMEGSNYKDDEIGLYLTNVKVATGVADTRHKLIEEGKFSTTGILFDFQSAVIKPESYGVIKEIATVLKENPTVKIQVIGHTSNDGDANANLALSKLRSAAVKDLLMKEFSVDGANITTEGKGASQPVADNKTKEGKAQNRRVEFVKM